MGLAVTASTTQEITLKPAVKSKLLRELRVYAELKSQLKALELAIDKHKGVIGDIREEVGEQSIKIDGFSITLVAPVRSTLSKEKLIALGVTMAQIEMATVVVPCKAYVKVTLPGADKDD